MKKYIAFVVIIVALLGGSVFMWHDMDNTIVQKEDALIQQANMLQEIAGKYLDMRDDYNAINELYLIEKAKPALVRLRNFKYNSSVKELETFLRADNLNLNLYDKDYYDCIDFAYELIRRAKDAGFIMYPYPMPGHLMCMALVETYDAMIEIYSVEPQNDATTFLGYYENKGHLDPVWLAVRGK